MVYRLLAMLAGLAVLVCASIAYSADGDQVSAGGTSQNFVVVAFLLCDGKAAADSSCAEFDLDEDALGIPKQIAFSIDSTTGCSSSPEVAITGANTSGGTEHTIASLATDGDTQVLINQAINRFIGADLSDDAGCTDLDVRMTLYYERGQS